MEKNNLAFKKITYVFTTILILTIILSGCSEKDNTNNIIDEKYLIDDSIVQSIDYENIEKIINSVDKFTVDMIHETTKTKYEDLNGDGIEEKIEYTVMSIKREAILKINDAEIQFHVDSPSSNFNIVDINQNDSYKEIDIFDGGASADPISTFYTYDGKNIIKIGEVYSYSYYLDGESRIFGKKLNIFEPAIIMGYTVMDEKQQYRGVRVNQSTYINKQYKLVKDLYSYYWGDEFMDRIKVGDIITVLDVDNSVKGSRMKVRLEDGTEGWIINLWHYFG